MDNTEIDELLQQLALVSEWEMNHDVNSLLSHDTFRKVMVNADDVFIGRVKDEIIKKVVTDFYAYNLYLEELGKKLPFDVLINMHHIINLKNDVGILKYFSSDLIKLTDIIDEYFKFHQKTIEFQCRTIANVVNQDKQILLSRYYDGFFAVNLDYYPYVLPQNVILGLKLIDIYKICQDKEVILNFMQKNFSDEESRNNFIGYMVSNCLADVMVYHKDVYDKYGSLNKQDNFVKFLQKQFSGDKFIINIFNLYFKIYENTKRSRFVDIRDKINFDDREIIYLLDPTYKHPNDIMKNVTDIYTIIKEIEDNLVDTLVEWEQQGFDDNKKVDMLFELLDGQLTYDFNDSKIFNENSMPYVTVLLKLLFTTYFYEYANYKYDELNDDEKDTFDNLDNCSSMVDVLKIFPSNEENILLKGMEYMFCSEEERFLAKKKIVSDHKIMQIIKMNQFVALEYRRIFGILFPFETSISTETGNWLVGIISDIIITSNKIGQDEILSNSSLSEEIKKQCTDRSFEEIVNFTVSNVYENICSSNTLSDLEEFIMRFVESGHYDVRKLLSDDKWLSELFFDFFKYNSVIFTDKSMMNLRAKTRKNNKIKYLRRIDPYFDIDGAIIGKI